MAPQGVAGTGVYHGRPLAAIRRRSVSVIVDPPTSGGVVRISAERVHPLAGVFAPKLIELVEILHLDLELQGRSPVAACQRDEQARLYCDGTQHLRGAAMAPFFLPQRSS